MKKNNISLAEIESTQRAWAAGIITIGKHWQANENYMIAAHHFVQNFYAYDFECGTVQFKPTRARMQPFRQTARSAISYFVGGDADFPEDTGFALMPWTAVHFDNQSYYHHVDIATVMGRYDFFDQENRPTRVEYTFGYVRGSDQKLKIFLHHSSLPYSKSKSK